MNMTTYSIEVRLKRARTSLLLDHPFFGSLLFRLKWREVTSIETMATDGVSLFYNREFVMGLPAAHLVGVLAHEALHPALRHHVRRGNRCPKLWNQACDYAINFLVLDAGLSLPNDALVSELYRGMSAEQIYNLLESSDSTDGGQANESSAAAAGNEDTMAPATPGGFGQVLDAPPPGTNNGESVEQQAAAWEIAVSQAQSVAKLAWPGAWRAARRPRSTGESCCAARGLRLSLRTIRGLAPIAGTSGKGSSFPECIVKAWARWSSSSTAPALSTNGNLAFLRPKCVRSLRDSGRRKSTWSTSTRRYRRSTATRLANPSAWLR